MTAPRQTASDAERIAELERVNAALNEENRRLFGQQSAAIRAERELTKHRDRIAQEQAMAFARTILSITYFRQQLPMVHTVIDRLVNGYAPKNAANWSELHQAADEIRQAKERCEVTGEEIGAALDRVATASRSDRAEWIEAASDDLRLLWHLKDERPRTQS